MPMISKATVANCESFPWGKTEFTPEGESQVQEFWLISGIKTRFIQMKHIVPNIFG